jgi:transcription initiation factor TFIIE subunit alpha
VWSDLGNRFDVEKYVRENFTEVDKETEDDGLKIAGGRHAIDEGIGIVIRTDKDEATKKEEREREAEAKRFVYSLNLGSVLIDDNRQQNQMPSWHLKSTISGDLTALGIQQQAREAARLQQSHILDSLTPTTPKSIDGLPSPVGLDSQKLQQASISGLAASGLVDVKPTIDHKSDCSSYSAAFFIVSLTEMSSQTMTTIMHNSKLDRLEIGPTLALWTQTTRI